MKIDVTYISVGLAVLFGHCIALGQELPVGTVRVPSGLMIEGLSGNIPSIAEREITPRPILQSALNLIKAFEGWDEEVYDDPGGYCTIGYGHLIAKAKCKKLEPIVIVGFKRPLTLETGNQLLANDTRDARRAIQNLVEVELNDHQFGALTSFVFNVGRSNFKKSTLLKYLNAGSYDNATRELLKWTSSNHKIFKGLVRRRNCEFLLFNDQLAQKSGKIDFSACDSSLSIGESETDSIDVVTGE